MASGSVTVTDALSAKSLSTSFRDADSRMSSVLGLKARPQRAITLFFKLPLKNLLKQIGAKQVKVVNMSQGQKVSRLIAWSFLTDEQQAQWNQQRLQG